MSRSEGWKARLRYGGVTAAVVVLGACGGESTVRPDTGVSAASAEKLLIVDCLLPGQVRKLGAAATYLTARRPAKLPASECEIRGGEYVAFDRADLRTSLNIWLPAAQAGDPQAQTYLGEIYEKGLGVPPDYGAAAQWYRKAADQGFSRAQTNLGYLYEKGLGVPRDPVQAMNWYRRASGLEDELVTASSVRELERDLAASRSAAAASRAEAADLRRQLQSVESDLRRKRSEEKRSEQELNETRIELRKQTELPRVAQPAPVNEADRQKIRELQQRLEDQARERSRLEEQAELLKSRLAAEQKGTQALEARLEQTQADLSALSAEKSRIAATQQKLLSDQHRASSLAAEEIAGLRGDLEAAQRELARQQAESDAQRSGEVLALEAQLSKSVDRIQALETELVQSRDKADQTELEIQRLRIAEAKQELEQAEKAIESGTPDLPPEQQAQVQRVRVRLQPLQRTLDEQDRELEGRLSQINASARELAETEGRIAALENETVALRGGEGRDDVSQKPSSVPGAGGFGGYYALVIGNNDYEDFPRLQTAVSDATALAAVLRQRYGFKTTLLTNATYEQILSTLNEFRKKLTDSDNLLIYYAGHGELDVQNDRGHWIPVNARADDTTHWISNVAVTDILNVMNAKHVMVIADSCYSGQLARSAVASVQGGRTPAQQAEFYEKIARIRSRTVLSSGGLKPVLDGGGGANSVFAKQLLAILHTNDRILEGPELYLQVSRRVRAAARSLGVDQNPQYGPIKHAGDQLAPFIFLPQV